jgi:hypothetical protein
VRCWNCGKKIRRNARACEFCAVPAEPDDDPPIGEAEMREIMKAMPPEAMEELRKAAAGSKTTEEFVHRIMVGPCPRCGSDRTRDCGADPQIEDPATGRCLACGQLWCTFCERLLTAEEPSCNCILEDDADE